MRVLAWLLQPTGDTGLAATALSIAWGTGLAARGPRLAWGYWPGCYRPQVGLGDTGLVAAGPRLV